MCASLRIYNVSPCVALYVALTLHYVALKRLSFFCTDVQYRVLSCQTVARGTLSNAKHPAGTQAWGEGLYAAPFSGMETRHGFGAAGWVLSGHSGRCVLSVSRSEFLCHRSTPGHIVPLYPLVATRMPFTNWTRFRPCSFSVNLFMAMVILRLSGANKSGGRLQTLQLRATCTLLPAGGSYNGKLLLFQL